MSRIISARDRLEQASDLSAVLHAAYEAFEAMRLAFRAHEDPATGLFAPFVMAAAAAADGRDAVAFAPSLPSGQSHGAPAAGEGPGQGQSAEGVAGQQRTRVGKHHRVVVHVHDPAFRRHRLRDLVRVIRSGNAGANVKELADSALGGQVAHRAGKERAVRPDVAEYAGIGGDRLLGGLPVGGEIVLAAQPVIVHPGHVRHAGVE